MFSVRCMSINGGYMRSNSRSVEANQRHLPYGSIALTCKTVCPGTFVILPEDCPDTFYPSLHGLSANALLKSHNVGLIQSSSETATSVVTAANCQDHLLYVVNTGSEPLTPGDSFTVVAPVGHDVSAQRKIASRQDYYTGTAEVKACPDVWGAVLATKPIKGASYCQELIERYTLGTNTRLSHFMSPSAARSMLGIFKLIAGLSHADVISGQNVDAALNASEGREEPDTNQLHHLLSDEHVADYVNFTLGAAAEIFTGMWGYATGRVIRSSEGSGRDPVNTGESFYATVHKMGCM